MNSFPRNRNDFKKCEKEKICPKMEILKTEGEPDKVLMKNVVYDDDDLRRYFENKNHTKEGEFPYATLLYKQSPSGKELFDLPAVKTYRGARKLFLCPKKITCDVVINADLHAESIVFKSVWKGEHKTIPFNDWLEETKEKIKEYEKLENEMEPLEHELSELSHQHHEIELELEELEFTELHIRS